jgi:hypothetical protein
LRKKIYKPLVFGGVSDCASHFVALLKKLICDVSSNKAVGPCNEDGGAWCDCGTIRSDHSGTKYYTVIVYAHQLLDEKYKVIAEM